MFKTLLHHSGVKCVNPTAMRSVKITLTKQVSLASIWLCGIVMARNRKRHSYCDVSTIRQTRHFRFWRRQISRWRRRWSRQTGRGGGAFFCLLFLSFNVCNMRYYMLSSCTRIALPFYYGAVACATFGYFLCMSMCVAYSTDYIQ